MLRLLAILPILLVAIVTTVAGDQSVWIKLAVFSGNCLVAGSIANGARFSSGLVGWTRWVVFAALGWIALIIYALVADPSIPARTWSLLLADEQYRWMMAILLEVVVLQWLVFRHNLAVQFLGHEVDASGRAVPPGGTT